MLMRKNVDNDVCIDSPIFGLVCFVLMSLRENGVVNTGVYRYSRVPSM